MQEWMLVWDNGERNMKSGWAIFVEMHTQSRDSAFNVAIWGIRKLGWLAEL